MDMKDTNANVELWWNGEKNCVVKKRRMKIKLWPQEGEERGCGLFVKMETFVLRKREATPPTSRQG
jgi:hypothetical protein